MGRHAIGSVLRRIRAERGATLRELSERSMVSIPYLSEIERGRKEASSEILAALCRVLDVTEGELLLRVAAEYAVAAPSEAPVLILVPETAPSEPAIAPAPTSPGAVPPAG